MNSSASGEVEASQNMARNIWKSKKSFRKNLLWSNLEGKSQNEQLKVNPCGLPQADDNIQKDW